MHDADSLTGILTPRERQVLELVGGGLDDEAIAEQLGIARSTVGMLLRSSKAKRGAIAVPLLAAADTREPKEELS